MQKLISLTIIVVLIQYFEPLPGSTSEPGKNKIDSSYSKEDVGDFEKLTPDRTLSKAISEEKEQKHKEAMQLVFKKALQLKAKQFALAISELSSLHGIEASNVEYTLALSDAHKQQGDSMLEKKEFEKAAIEYKAAIELLRSNNFLSHSQTRI